MRTKARKSFQYKTNLGLYTFEYWRITQGTIIYSVPLFGIGGEVLFSHSLATVAWLLLALPIIYAIVAVYYFVKFKSLKDALVIAALRQLTFLSAPYI